MADFDDEKRPGQEGKNALTGGNICTRIERTAIRFAAEGRRRDRGAFVTSSRQSTEHTSFTAGANGPSRIPQAPAKNPTGEKETRPVVFTD